MATQSSQILTGTVGANVAFTSHTVSLKKIMKIKSSLLAACAVSTACCLSANGALLIENFGYANGSIVGASGSPWINNTGTAGQSDVTSNALNVTGTESEDIAAPFSSTATFGIVTATFDVNFSVLPTTAGSYFAHFITPAPTNGFSGRVWSARPTGTATGAYRLGIANTTGAAVFITVDLATAATYTLSLSLNLATDIASLSIFSGSTLLGSASGTDSVSNVSIGRFGFRQANNIGTLRVDNLSVVPEPESALLGGLGLICLLRRRRF